MIQSLVEKQETHLSDLERSHKLKLRQPALWFLFPGTRMSVVLVPGKRTRVKISIAIHFSSNCTSTNTTFLYFPKLYKTMAIDKWRQKTVYFVKLRRPRVVSLIEGNRTIWTWRSVSDLAVMAFGVPRHQSGTLKAFHLRGTSQCHNTKFPLSDSQSPFIACGGFLFLRPVQQH